MKMWIATALAAIGLVVAAPQAHADDELYLEVIKDQHFYELYGPQVLLSEGHIVCDYIAGGGEWVDAIDVVEADLPGLSTAAAAYLVGAAMSGLGC